MKKILLLLALVLVFLLGRYFVSEKPNNQEPMPQTISVDEMARFLPVWSEYMESSASKKEFAQLSLGTGDISAKTQKWLAKKGWDAERFFYVEQRLEVIVKTAYLREHATSNINQLREQIRYLERERITNPNDDYKQRLFVLDQQVEVQKQNMNVENVSEEEISMVEANLAYINGILEGRIRF